MNFFRRIFGSQIEITPEQARLMEARSILENVAEAMRRQSSSTRIGFSTWEQPALPGDVVDGIALDKQIYIRSVPVPDDASYHSLEAIGEIVAREIEKEIAPDLSSGEILISRPTMSAIPDKTVNAICAPFFLTGMLKDDGTMDISLLYGVGPGDIKCEKFQWAGR